ncbi:MAG: hypothetical protein V7L26_00790 [Nostoc sp.]|uniref:hypothetical protein n=1 Tax=Nostoc sp. TaxID=1180 RepID=UPI002FF24D00
MSEATIPSNRFIASQPGEPSNYFIDVTFFLLGYEIKAEIPITKQQLRIILKETADGVPDYDSTMEDIVSRYMDENVEVEHFLKVRT